MGGRTGMGAEPTPGTGSQVGLFGRAKERAGDDVVWGALAVLLMVLAVVAAGFGARTLANSDAATSRQAFRTSAAEIASALQLGIQHEEDLMVSAGGFVAGNPDATNTELVRWARSVRALERYPEVLGIAHVVIVPAAELSAFAARAVLDPAGPLAADKSFKVVPAGVRPYFCLSVGGISADQGTNLPAGFDFCPVDPQASPTFLARDTGQSGYYPFKLGKETVLTVLTPVYRGGLVPSTVSGRRAAFLGCIGMRVAPKVVLDRARQSHPGTSVALRYQRHSSSAVFSSGAAPAGSESVTTSLGNGWSVQTSGPVATGGVLTNKNALALLTARVVMSVLLGLLVFVLGTSRARALRLVAERTQIATHDALTGLPNRLLFADRAVQVLAVARRTGSRPAVLMLDLDRFKEVNDTLGHLHGDLLLIQVARRLTEVLRPGDTVARFGGDEFALLLSDGGSEAGAEVASRIARALEAPFVLGDPVLGDPVLDDAVLDDPVRDDAVLDGSVLDDSTVNIEASIGIATAAPHEQPTLEELLRRADVAMYRAKSSRCGFTHFEASGNEPAPNHLRLVGELRQALEGGELVVYYQPKVAVDTDELLGVEALVRWQHPTRGLLLPEELITLAERSSLIQRLTTFVLDSALRCCRTWLDQGLRLPVAVNVSARSLGDPRFPAMVSERLAQAGIPAELLTIELTAGTVLACPDLEPGILQKLQDMGVHICVDDYGIGRSSKACLLHLPVTEDLLQRWIEDRPGALTSHTATATG